jgi:hypothetical protein
MHWCSLLAATAGIGFAFIRAAWYYRQADLSLPESADLSPQERKRLKHYFYGTTYLSAVFCLLRGKSRSKLEKKLFLNMAALAGFFDDMTDGGRRTADGGRPVTLDIELYGAMADRRGIAQHLLDRIYLDLPAQQLPAFKNYLQKVFEVELRHKPSGIVDITELEKLSAEKGGYSVLLFRSLLDDPVSVAEHEALFQFGALVQLCDDIFDIWFDRQAGIRTMPVCILETGRLPELAAIFERQVATTKARFALLKGIKSAMAWGAVSFLVAVTRVCLHHYADLTKKHGNLQLDNRAAMVVDMDTFKNKLRAAWRLIGDNPADQLQHASDHP